MQGEGSMKKHPLTVLITTLGLVVLFLAADPAPYLSKSGCDPESFLATHRPLSQIHPVKVVVEPWKGEHHVYGVFLVPDTFRDKPPILVTIKTVGSYCGTGYTPNKSIDGILAPDGFFMMKQMIRTRSVLWSILQGNFPKLADPQNWVLTF